MIRYASMVLIFCGFLTACQAPSTQPINDLSGPDSKALLCQALGKDPNTEPLCEYTQDGELRQLLLSAFPLGVATQTDVRAHIGIYLLSTEITKTRVFETYAVEQTIFPDTPVKAIFSFDQQGILRQIDIIDIM